VPRAVQKIARTGGILPKPLVPSQFLGSAAEH
jgi:hypothetical protein